MRWFRGLRLEALPGMTGLLPIWQPIKEANAVRWASAARAAFAVVSATCTRSLSSAHDGLAPDRIWFQKPGGCAAARWLWCATTTVRMTRTVTAVTIARPARTASVMRMIWRRISTAWMTGPATAEMTTMPTRTAIAAPRPLPLSPEQQDGLHISGHLLDRSAARDVNMAGLNGLPGAVNVGHATYPFSGLTAGDWACGAGPEERNSSWPGVPVR